MKKAFIALCVLIVLGAGAGYYFFQQDKHAQEAKRTIQIFLHEARTLANEKITYLQNSERERTINWEKTHSNEAIIAAAKKLIDEEWLSGRNYVGGKNWTPEMNKLRETCNRICAFNPKAKILIDSMSFNGMIGKDFRFELDSILPPYYVSDSAWVDVHFNLIDSDGSLYPDKQKMTMKLHFYEAEKRWLINDFEFYYPEEEQKYYSEVKEMYRVIQECSMRKESEEKEE